MKSILILCSLFALQFSLYSQELYEVQILRADEAVMEPWNGETIKKLVGKVQLKHKSTLIDCDSATVFASNNIDATGHVTIRKGSGSRIQGDILHYFSNQKVATVNSNVILTDKKAKLYTQDITYDMNHDIAYYMSGGKMINGESEITSQMGTYYNATSSALFRTNVRVNHPKYNLTSDSLIYNTKLKRVEFKNSTKIENDSGYIWCNSGWHDEEKDQSTFGRGTIIYNGTQWIMTDSIFSDKKNGRSTIYKTFEFHDTAMKMHVFGDTAEMYNENKDIKAFKRPILIVESENSNPTFVRGDILESKTLKNDSKILTALGKVRIYNKEYQGASDSFQYFSIDSMMRMTKNSTLWMKENQVTGLKIDIYFKNRKPSKMNVFDQAFMIQEEEIKTHYNQIKSDTMYSDFVEGKLDRLKAIGNAKSIYYGKEEGKGYVGINSSESYSLLANFDSSKVSKITFYDKPKAIFYPVKDMTEQNRFLPNFIWKDALRPKSKDDI